MVWTTCWDNILNFDWLQFTKLHMNLLRHELKQRCEDLWMSSCWSPKMISRQKSSWVVTFKSQKQTSDDNNEMFVTIPSHNQCQTFHLHSLCVFKLPNTLHAPGLVFSPYLMLNWAICAPGGEISLIWTDCPIHLFTSYFKHQSPSSNITGEAVDWGWWILGTTNWNVNLPIKISCIDSGFNPLCRGES